MAKNLINISIYLFFSSFLVIDTFLPFNIYGLNIFIIDGVFLLLLLIIISIAKYDLIKFFFNYKNFFFIETVSISILLIFILKFLFDFSNFYNFYQLISFVYILLLYFTFKFLISNYENCKNRIITSFIYIFFISIIIIFFVTIIYYLDIQTGNYSLWEKAEHYPYHNKPVLHINGLIKNYNMFAYTMVPGFIFFIFKNYINKPYKFILLLIFFTSILAFFVKAKIFMLVFSVSFVFFIYYHFKNITYSKYLLFLSTLFIIFFYIMTTNFIILETNEVNKLMVNNYPRYYTLEPLSDFFDYSIYGTFFYKLKLVAFEQAKSFNFLIFNSMDFLSFFDVFTNNMNVDFTSLSGSEPHSHYFSFLGDFGFLGLLIILLFSSYPFYILIKRNIDKELMPLIVILIIFFIEGINTDIINFRFVWIILALIYFQFHIKKINKL